MYYRRCAAGYVTRPLRASGCQQHGEMHSTGFLASLWQFNCCIFVVSNWHILEYGFWDTEFKDEC